MPPMPLYHLLPTGTLLTLAAKPLTPGAGSWTPVAGDRWPEGLVSWLQSTGLVTYWFGRCGTDSKALYGDVTYARSGFQFADREFGEQGKDGDRWRVLRFSEWFWDAALEQVGQGEKK